MKKRIPNDIDIDQIFFFVQEMTDQKEYNAEFWKGEDTPGDGIETVFARTRDADTILGTIDVADNLEKLARWLRTLTEAND